MVYLTKILIDSGHPDAIDILADGQAAHKFVMRGFPNTEVKPVRKTINVLYKCNFGRLGSEKNIIVQSDVKPFVERYYTDFSSAEESVYIDDVINSVKDGMIVKVRMDVSVSKDHQVAGGKAKRIELKDPKEYAAWIEKKMSDNGASLLGWDRIDRTVVNVYRNPKPFYFNRDHIIAAVKIENAVAFKNMLVKGIGKSKAYGCGLVMLCWN